MNQKFRNFLKNFMHALSANVIRLMISVVMTLVLPRILGVEEYSYWQLYLFYVTYTAYSSIGWCEGTYLKYGGMEYAKLDRSRMAGQFWALAVFQLIFCTVFGTAAHFLIDNPYKSTILMLALVSSMFDILRYLLQNILQTTGRIKDFARIMTLERMLFFVLSVGALLLGFRNFYVLIFMEITGRILSMCYAMYVCREIVFAKSDSFHEITKESKEIIGIGYKLLAASFASQLIIGIVRFAIEQKWGTIVFGKVSLTLSLSNMVITCIGAVSVVLFPMLKKMKEETLEELFLTMRTVLTVPVLAVLIFYTPMRWILELWLPQYHDSLHYLAVLFPICVYETRSVALIDTYLKAYRKEKLILFNSLVTVGISALLSWITVFLMGSLDAAVISIVLLMMFKNIFSEKMLLRSSLPVKVWKDNILEVALTGIFILVNWKIGGITAMLLYTAAYIIYVLLKSKDIKREMKNLKKIARG